MHLKSSWRAALQRRLFMAAFLPSLGGCIPAAQVAQFNSLSLDSARTHADVSSPDLDPFPSDATLSREVLIEEVLLRNPSVESARLAWREALAHYPQATAYADPELSYEAAPGTMGSQHGYGQVVRLSQRLEWPGKQALRGAVALAEAEARSAGLDGVRLHLRTAASIVYDDYFAVRRALEINREHLALVTRLQKSAEAQYGAGRGSQQDPIQADVELALLERERLALVARGQVISAQINGLLHRPAASPLPAAPARLDIATLPALSDSQWLQRAQEGQPELREASGIVDARRSGVDLAARAFFPDFSVAAAYSTMWPQAEHPLMMGLSVNIPIQLGARRAGLEQASARLAWAESEQAEQLKSVDVDVRQALVLFEESVAQAVVYRDRILPATRSQIEAAEAGYINGRNSFSDIMTAQRRLRTFEQEYAEALANTWRRRALLTRAVGSAPQQLDEGGVR